jgi:hypothetical protein
MPRPFIESIDFTDLERRLSNDDKIEYFDETDPEEIANRFATIQPYLIRLPKREQDLLFMHYVLRKKQTELGMIFNRTQAAISYRIRKAVVRIRFLVDLPDVTEDEIRRDLTGIFSDFDLNLMVGMWRHTCQTQVAKDLGSDQCTIRHRFYKNIRLLKQQMDYNDMYSKYYTLFTKIRDNTNILREVKLGRWDIGDYVVDECSI